jgi:hypothetical protein
MASATGSSVRGAYERQSLPGGNTRTTIYHDPYPVYMQRAGAAESPMSTASSASNSSAITRR